MSVKNTDKSSFIAGIIMKPFLFVLTLICLSLISCQKELSLSEEDDNSNSSYYIKFKLEGVAKKFIYEDSAAITMNALPGFNRLDIQGFASDDDDDLEGIGFGINFTTSTLSPGTYTEPNDLVLVVYSPNDPTLVYSGGLHASPVTPTTITINTITSKEVTGTFQCTGYKTITDGNGNIISVEDEYKTITEGEFKVPMIQ
jgi:hypothetical protein